MLIIQQQIEAIASGAVVVGEMEGPSWRESSCFFQEEKLELDVCKGKGGGGCAGLEEQCFPLKQSPSQLTAGLTFLIFTRPF